MNSLNAPHTACMLATIAHLLCRTQVQQMLAFKAALAMSFLVRNSALDF